MKRRLQQLAGLKPLYEQENRQEYPPDLRQKIISALEVAFEKLEREVGDPIKKRDEQRGEQQELERSLKEYREEKTTKSIIKKIIKEQLQKQEIDNFLETGKITKRIQTLVDAYCVENGLQGGEPIPPSVLGLSSDDPRLKEHYYMGQSFTGPGLSHTHLSSNSQLYCMPQNHKRKTRVKVKQCNLYNPNYGVGDLSIDPINAPNGPHWEVGDVFDHPNGNRFYIVQVIDTQSTTSSPVVVTPVSPSPGYCCGCAHSCDNISGNNFQGSCNVVPYWPDSTWPGSDVVPQLYGHYNTPWSLPFDDPFADIYTGPGGTCWNFGQTDLESCPLPSPCCKDPQAQNYDPNCPNYMADLALCSYFVTDPLSGSDLDPQSGMTGLFGSTNPNSPFYSGVVDFAPTTNKILVYFNHIYNMIMQGYSDPVICEWLQDKLDQFQNHPQFNNPQQQNPANYAFYLNNTAAAIQYMMTNWFLCDQIVLTGPVVNPNTGLNFDPLVWQPTFLSQLANQVGNECPWLTNKVSNWQSSLVNAGPAQSAMLNSKIAYAQSLCQQNACTTC